jgi:hypothetical protein
MYNDQVSPRRIRTFNPPVNSHLFGLIESRLVVDTSNTDCIFPPSF